MIYNYVNKDIELIGKEVVDIAFQIHKTLGPGLLEKIYEKCFVLELQERGLIFEQQKTVNISYKQHIIKEALKIDLLIENSIIVELKAQEIYNKLWEAQLISYLKLTNKSLGYIINFNVPTIKDGIKRFIN